MDDKDSKDKDQDVLLPDNIDKVISSFRKLRLTVDESKDWKDKSPAIKELSDLFDEEDLTEDKLRRWLTIDADALLSAAKMKEDIKSLPSDIDNLLAEAKAEKGIRNTWFLFKLYLCKGMIRFASWGLEEKHMKNKWYSLRFGLYKKILKAVLWILGEK